MIAGYQKEFVMRQLSILVVLFAAMLALMAGCEESKELVISKAEVKEGYHPKVAVQMYVFTQDRFRRKIKFWDDLDNVLGEVKAGGADTIEAFLDWFETDERAEKAKKLLAKHNLKISGLYRGGVFHDEELAHKSISSILDSARRVQEFAPIYITVNPHPIRDKVTKYKPKTDEQLATQVKMLNLLGQKLAEMNMQLLIHHHDPEMRDNAREQRYNVAHLDPNYVGFCLDVHWIYRGGQDPMTLLKETGPKLKALHLRNSVNNVWTESFGPGDIDYVGIAEYLKENNFDGWLVLEMAHENETKVTRSLVENIRVGLDYLKTIFLQ